jgi:hypothetical protein
MNRMRSPIRDRLSAARHGMTFVVKAGELADDLQRELGTRYTVTYKEW